ncbi:MAG: hypothetical protein LBF68_03770 [Christensenellaceae bacterium]|jgi:hypothetical protein|nr:hypothetical protein [Christensenellaceae bacterium]
MINRAYRNRELTAEEKEINRERSRIRARVEQIWLDEYDIQKDKGTKYWSEKVRNEIVGKNLLYNINRYIYLKSLV